jgi:hypothetical protein
LGLRGRIGTELQELQPSNNKSPQTKEVEMKEKQKRHGQVMVQTKEVEMKEKQKRHRQVTVDGVLCELNVLKFKECNV